MVVSSSGSGAVRPKRKSRGRKVASVTSVKIPMAVSSGKALDWDDLDECLIGTRRIWCNEQMKKAKASKLSSRSYNTDFEEAGSCRFSRCAAANAGAVLMGAVER